MSRVKCKSSSRTRTQIQTKRCTFRWRRTRLRVPAPSTANQRKKVRREIFKECVLLWRAFYLLNKVTANPWKLLLEQKHGAHHILTQALHRAIAYATRPDPASKTFCFLLPCHFLFLFIAFASPLSLHHRIGCGCCRCRFCYIARHCCRCRHEDVPSFVPLYTLRPEIPIKKAIQLTARIVNTLQIDANNNTPFAAA